MPMSLMIGIVGLIILAIGCYVFSRSSGAGYSMWYAAIASLLSLGACVFGCILMVLGFAMYLFNR